MLNHRLLQLALLLVDVPLPLLVRVRHGARYPLWMLGWKGTNGKRARSQYRQCELVVASTEEESGEQCRQINGGG